MLKSSQAFESQETPPFVSVVIATYRRGDFLVDTIAGIMDNNYPKFELIIVDQTPSHPPEISTRLEALIEKYHLSYYKLDLPSVTVARNVGIRKAKGEIIVFCDDDVAVGKEYISSHVQAYQDPRVGGIAGRIISKIDEKLAHPSGLIARLNPDGSYIANFHLEQPGEAEICMGCNMSFRRLALLGVGLFDERYKGNFYLEDVDAFVRVKRSGFKMLFEPKTLLHHLVAPEGGCRKDIYLTRMYYCFRNETLFFFNCMSYSNIFAFLFRMLRTIKATVIANKYSWLEGLYLLRSLLDGLAVYLFEKPDQLSKKLNI